jgi:hypothetical protein
MTMSSEVDKFFEKAAGAKMNAKGQKLGDGKYLVKAKLMKIIDGHWGNSFIFEFDVLQSAHAEHPVGSTRSYRVDMKKEQAFGDIKAVFFALCMGIDPSGVKNPPADQELHNECVELIKLATKEGYAESLGEKPEDAYAGMTAWVEVKWQKTADGQREWARHKWLPVEAPAAG